MGTIAALAPIAMGISEKTDFPIAICIAAVVSGAMFGDNLSMISDTTIAAVRTQGCDMRDKFRKNFFDCPTCCYCNYCHSILYDKWSTLHSV